MENRANLFYCLDLLDFLLEFLTKTCIYGATGNNCYLFAPLFCEKHGAREPKHLDLLENAFIYHDFRQVVRANL